MLKYDKKWKLKFVCILNFSYFFLFHGQHRPLQLVLHNSPLPSTCSCITYLPSPTPTRSLLSLDNTLISSPLLNSFFFLRLPSLLLLFTPSFPPPFYPPPSLPSFYPPPSNKNSNSQFKVCV